MWHDRILLHVRRGTGDSGRSGRRGQPEGMPDDGPNLGRERGTGSGCFLPPMTLEQQLFVIFTLQDISHEKRRRVLERLFFHDVLNTAGVTQNLATLLADMVPPGDASEYVRLISASSAEVVSEIIGQRVLAAVENHELEVAVAPVKALACI